MRQPLVAGNWKMHGDRASVSALVAGIAGGLGADCPTEVLLCPPFVYLDQVKAALGEGIALGAQDLSAESQGAFTGEIEASMLRDVGCTYVLVGHSERRTLMGETDAVVARKFSAAQAAGLRPVLCVGETLEEREEDRTTEVIARQVAAVVNHAGAAALENAVVAYEPVWAIGTGKTASPAQAQEVHAAIRSLVTGHDAKIAGGLRILYGGSVKGANASELFAMDDIDGGLIGGASLDAAEFLAICHAN